MTTMAQRNSRRGGFTFIELINVWLIIAILAAILFPVFAKAREKARSTTCANNLINIGIALRVYAHDYAGHYPPVSNDLRPLVPTWLPEERSLLCPSAVGMRSEEGLKVPRVPPTGWSDYVYWAGWCDDDQPGAMFVADDRSDRHNDGCNYLFTDGHAKWMSAMKGAETKNDDMLGWKSLRTLRADKAGVRETVPGTKESEGPRL
jgi:prepilin-type processing-associated H-X9-DG protein